MDQPSGIWERRPDRPTVGKRLYLRPALERVARFSARLRKRSANSNRFFNRQKSWPWTLENPDACLQRRSLSSIRISQKSELSVVPTLNNPRNLPGSLAQITKNGQTFYVFPDAANNRAYVGGPDQYQALVNYRLSQHLAAEQLATSPAYADPSLGWDTWNGWPGTYGHQRRVERRAGRRAYYGY